HSDSFPVIACMTWDFLAILATSVSVKQLVFKSHHLCRNSHLSFKAMTIMEVMCVKKWLEDLDLFFEVISKPQ
ncbi:hypothetical protein CONPUDRAFT_45036, partial [Coniophora puteana RWD-64-598 SS2]